MPKNKPCKGLLKRIRFTKSGKVKFRRAFGRHLRSHKSAKLRRTYRKSTYAVGCEARRVKAMLFTSVKTSSRKPAATTTEGEGE